MKTHVFDNTIGPGPYRFVGTVEMPSKSLAEHNPSAYMNALKQLPRIEAGLGSCAHCGTAITLVCLIKNGDNKVYGVGSTCIEKTGDRGLKKEVDKVASNRRRIKAKEKYDKQLACVRKYLDENKEEFKKKPHPSEYHKDKSWHDYLEFSVTSCGKAGMNRMYKDIFGKS